MKKITSFMTLLSILALEGCSMGFVPTGLESPKSYLENWHQPAINFDAKEQDSLSCGGSARGPDFRPDQLNTVRQPGDTTTLHRGLDCFATGNSACSRKVIVTQARATTMKYPGLRPPAVHPSCDVPIGCLD